MTARGSPFSARMVLALLVVGGGAFLLFLYAIGAGWDGRDGRDGGAHAAANGLNGFEGLVKLLEARGHDVTLSRSEARLEEEVLLVLTPPVFSDGTELAEMIEARRYVGPTLVILPKWLAGTVPADAVAKAVPSGWVALGGAFPPEWVSEIAGLEESEVEVVERKKWQAFGLSGSFPDPERVLTLDDSRVLPLVTDETGDVFAGYLADAGYYPVLADAAGMPARDEEDPGTDSDLWPLVIIAEPDLANNYGLADPARAEAAVRIVEAAIEDYDLPIVFDLTLPGLGRSQNLMTLAFQPPFLAATLCLLLAGIVIAWRALRRFGPPVAEAPALAMGKRQLARNGGGLVERAKRLHLLGPPYAALIASRTAAALGLRESDPQAREAAIARVLAARGLPADFPDRADALRRARRPHDLLRAAGALRAIERTLAK